MPSIHTSTEQLYLEAQKFISQYYRETEKSKEELTSRLVQIEEEIENKNDYQLTLDELSYGAKLAWRNSNRCVGRLFWKSLHVIDARSITSPIEAFKKLCEHIKLATNEGNIRSFITIFGASENRYSAPIQILNHQLIRYAGYLQEDGSIIGDPQSVEFTKLCIQLGWESVGSHFDILPLVIKTNDGQLHLFEWPEDIILEIPITHPANQEVSELGLKWYAVPIISDMLLEIGGQKFYAAPFNGYYMSTEVATRNMADTHRYNQLPQIAQAFKMDTTNKSMLWQDRALIELNTAVLHSYEIAGVKMVDHHTATKQHQQFEQVENKSGRSITGDWTWLVPPMSGSLCPVFHQEFENRVRTPNFFNKEKGCPFHKN